MTGCFPRAFNILIAFVLCFLEFIFKSKTLMNTIFGLLTSVLQGQRLRNNEPRRIYSEACLELCSEMNIIAIDRWSTLWEPCLWEQYSGKRDPMCCEHGPL